jgi:GntR family transcriptional regulator/MocR family aminotransferase
LANTLIYLDPDSPLNLQNQIRQKLVDGILSGALPPGHKLPSSRALAEQLEVSRNTVVLAYQQLVAEVAQRHLRQPRDARDPRRAWRA